MGARVTGVELAKDIAEAFLSSTFDPEGRSAGNVDAINKIDEKYNQVLRDRTGRRAVRALAQFRPRLQS